MHIVNNAIGQNEFSALTGEEIELLAAYRASNPRGRLATLEKARRMVAAHPAVKQPQLSLAYCRTPDGA